MSGVQQAVFQNQRSFGTPPGQQAYTTSGTFTWVAPTGVTSVSAVVVGAGQSGSLKSYNGCCYQAKSGMGGSLAYLNNYTVTPGSSYTVVVGSSPSIGKGGNSYFSGTGVVLAKGGCQCGPSVGTASYRGGYGNNCSSITAGPGGGGAGGYSGIGGAAGASGSTLGCAGAGGAGGGGGAGFGGGGGGGVGLLGQGSSGCRGAWNPTNGGGGGGGGSGGASGASGVNSGGGLVNGGDGGAYGGGGGAAAYSTNPSVVRKLGGVGAARIIWPGTTRSFPSTNTGDL